MITRNNCLLKDQQDSLAEFKQAFALPEGILYLDGNSLGARPKSAQAISQNVIEQEWGDGLVRSWNQAGWFDLPVTLGNKLGQLLGANDNEVVITDTTSLNLFKALAAALRIQKNEHPKRKIIVAERDNFPTDLYIIQGMIDFIQQDYELRLIDQEYPLEEALDEDVAVLLLSHVNYRTGYLYDMATTNKLAHQFDILTIWDLAHAAGAVPVNLNQDAADFAIGCTYKYLNGGPGSPAFIWVAQKHQQQVWQPLSGWWGHSRPFDMALDYEPANNIRRFLCGTQPIVSMAMIESGLNITIKASMLALRAKSLALTDLFISLVAQECAHHPLTLITPTAHPLRGSHVSYLHPQGFAVMQALIARGVIGDYREPEGLRFGIAPLYLSYTDIWDAVLIFKEILDTKAWDQPQFHQRTIVT